MVRRKTGMAIRCASKAIIINNGAVLLNKCKHEDGRIYYDLPGGWSECIRKS